MIVISKYFRNKVLILIVDEGLEILFECITVLICS